MIGSRTIWALVSAGLCVGCAFVPRGDEKFRMDKPVLSADRARYVGSDPAGEFPVPTKDQVEAAWGKPDVVEPPRRVIAEAPGQAVEPGKDGVRLGRVLLWGKPDSGGTTFGVRNERWIYKDGRRWTGTWIWILIVPIPLLYPTTNQLAVEFSGESVVALETVNTAHDPTTICGIGFAPAPIPVPVPLCGSLGQREFNRGRFVSARQLLSPMAAGVATTLAGTSGAVGSNDGSGAAARFKYPQGVATDKAGNVYVADTENHLIRKITPAGRVTTLAGSAGVAGSSDGTGPAASFNRPQGVAVDNAGNVYVADTYNHTIRKVTPEGAVSTLAGTADVVGGADGMGPAAGFSYPGSVATDRAGNVYVADTNNDAIRRITPRGLVTTLAGTVGTVGSSDGAGTAASFHAPRGVTTDEAGNLYVADTANNVIRKIAPGGVVTTLASPVAFDRPAGIAIDGAGDIYVADTGSNAIRKITREGVLTLAGPVTGGFSLPSGIATDGAGNVYVADTNNSIIRKLAPAPTVGR